MYNGAVSFEGLLNYWVNNITDIDLDPLDLGNAQGYTLCHNKIAQLLRRFLGSNDLT